jgi:hypothetical protein
MATSAFVQSLYQICLEENSTVTIEAIRNLALQKIAAGEVKTLVTSTLNGKSYSFNVSKAADILFSEASEAIRLFNNGVITVSQFDFLYI